MKVETDVNTKSAILGTYEGECADANITNLNGLDITREVWEHVFSSEEYKKGIKLGHFIGFLGHPDGDADYQNFQYACIVMTEGHIADNGKVYGKFNLVDTPVGRIVKSFQDAGVTFGISVRGAGDIINNSVDPDTFVFRGFDLVTFPAFPESIPTFTAIAASTDADKRKKYQAVCASVRANIEGLNTVESVNIVQSCFAAQSDEYKELEAHKAVILGTGDSEPVEVEPLAEPGSFETISSELSETCDPRVDAVTKLYLETKAELDSLRCAYEELKSLRDQLMINSSRKIDSIERICNSQIRDLNRSIEASESSRKKDQRTNKRLAAVHSSVLSQKDLKISALEGEIEDLKDEIKNLKKALQNCTESESILQSKNLEYNTKIKAAKAAIEDKDSQISSLKNKLNETVRQNAQREANASNRDEEMGQLNSKVEASEALIREYQDAYSSLYANALGVRLPQLRVTANTSVSNLQNMIRSTASASVRSNSLEPTQGIDPSDFDMTEYDEDGLVTL